MPLATLENFFSRKKAFGRWTPPLLSVCPLQTFGPSDRDSSRSASPGSTKSASPKAAPRFFLVAESRRE